MVQVGIKTLSDTTVYIQAYVVPVICGPVTQQSTELTQSSYEHLRDLPLADRAGGGVLAVSILVGADYHWSLVEGTLVRGAPWEPVALATKLGFVLSGPTMVMCDNVHANTVNLTASHVLKVESSVINHGDLAAELKKFWDYESYGEFMMTMPLCMTSLLMKLNLWKEDIKCDYHSRRIMTSFPIILHCANQGWCHC